MRQLVFEGAGTLRWDDVPEPELTGGDAIVRPDAVALCDLDTGALAGIAPLPGPYHFGHEFAGTVVAVADDVTSARPGDRVVVPFQISCGQCPPCQKGHTSNCTTVPKLSSFGLGPIGGHDWGGALADVVRVPFAQHMLVPLPDDVSFEAAANAGDNLADAHRTVGPHLQANPGAEVLVIGGGGPSIGLWAAELAVRLGSSRVRYVDTDPTRLRLAEEGGAEPYEGEPPTRGGRFPITVDAGGTPEGLRAALLSTAPDGVCTSSSVFWEDVPFPLLNLYSTNVTFSTGRVHSRGALPTVLGLLRDGVIDPTRIAQFVDWDDIPDGLVDAAARMPKVIARRAPS